MNNLFLKQNDTNNFKLVVKYNNSTENQIVDSGKIINAIFSFDLVWSTVYDKKGLGVIEITPISFPHLYSSM